MQLTTSIAAGESKPVVASSWKNHFNIKDSLTLQTELTQNRIPDSGCIDANSAAIEVFFRSALKSIHQKKLQVTKTKTNIPAQISCNVILDVS